MQLDIIAQLGDVVEIWRIILKWILKRYMGWHELNWSDSAPGRVLSSCDQVIKPSCFMKYWDFV